MHIHHLNNHLNMCVVWGVNVWRPILLVLLFPEKYYIYMWNEHWKGKLKASERLLLFVGHSTWTLKVQLWMTTLDTVDAVEECLELAGEETASDSLWKAAAVWSVGCKMWDSFYNKTLLGAKKWNANVQKCRFLWCIVMLFFGSYFPELY